MKLDFFINDWKNGNKKGFQFRFLNEMSRLESAVFDEIGYYGMVERNIWIFLPCYTIYLSIRLVLFCSVESCAIL